MFRYIKESCKRCHVLDKKKNFSEQKKNSLSLTKGYNVRLHGPDSVSIYSV